MKIENLGTKKFTNIRFYSSSYLKTTFGHSTYPQELKLSKVIPLYKKLDALEKKDYRPASL